MSRRTLLVLIAIFSLTFAGLPAAAQEAAQGAGGQPGAVSLAQASSEKPDLPDKTRIEPEVGSTERFVVEFEARPDLSDAYDIGDFRARGEFVIRELRETADRSQREARDLVARRGVNAEFYWFRNVMVVEGDDAVIDELALLPGVAEVRPERVYPLVRPVGQSEPIVVAAGDPEWGISQIGADLVWDEGILGGGVVVANIDSGVDYSHPALTNQYRGNLGNGTFSHDYNWWDPTGICGDEPCDNVFHGTHTMGTIVGGDGPGPFTPDIGVAPGAQWIAAKGCEDFGCSESALLSSGQWVLAPTDLNGENPDPAKRPDIVNNSWGGGPGDDFYLETVQNWRAAGIIPVFSAGNPGPFCGEGGSPGDFIESFSVGATDFDDVIAEFSGRGPSVYGKVNPDVSAPGVGVVSAVPGGGYEPSDGTSMAAPHVAGTLALVLSSTPELYGDFDGATSAVASTAIDIIDLSCGGDEDGDPNNVYGEGRIDAYSAVQLVATGGTLTGTITDAATGSPIAGARVVATADDRDFAVTADDNGVYRMFVPANQYVVTAEKFGYETAVVSGVVVETDQTTTQDLALIALPSFTVRGRVARAENWTPIAGAEVRALGAPIPPAITDGRGRYSLTLPLGVYTLEASKGGCLSTDQREVELFRDTRADLALVLLLDDFGHGCELIPYDWEDATLPITVYGDDQTGRMPLPFPFSYFGTEYNELFIASNGYLAFEDVFLGFSDFFNVPIPDQFEPNAAIYALWQDLWVVDAAHIDWDVVTVDGQQVLVIEYVNVPRLGSDEGADFEVKLWEDGTIDLLYGANIGNLANGGEATIGIENATGTDGLMYSYRSPIIEPESALRYSEVPVGTATGTVSNANDALPVAGVTVTATPGGRSAVTDANGEYSLKLVPGRYNLTFTADGYETAIRSVRIRVDRSTKVDVSLAAGLAVVTPAELIVTAEVEQAVTETVTVANEGSAVLTWEAMERETGVTPPDLPSASLQVTRPATAERFVVPDGFEPDLRAWPTFEGELEEIISDPAGDAGSPVDVIAVRGGADSFEVSFEVEYSADTPMNLSHNFLFLDTDQDPSSGLPPEALFGLPTQDIGMEYFVDFWVVDFEQYAIVVDANSFEVVAEIGMVADGQRLRFDIPLEVLGGDDGAMDVALSSNDTYFEGFDWAPDEGHGTVEPFRDALWMTSDPASGTLLPGDSVDVSVTLGGPGFDPGEYTGELVFLTNDPRQRSHDVAVALTIELPADFGGLQGTITNARAGFPLPATVVVQAERNGTAYPVVKQALDTDGSYLLFGPEGTWPVTVDFGGYETWVGEATITAGATTTLDAALRPMWPFATLEGGPIEMEVAAGESATAELALGNVDGLAALDFEFFELDLSGAAEVAQVDIARPGLDAAATSSNAPEGHEATAVEPRLTNGAEAVVFMDVLPWDSEALLQVLDANGVIYGVVGSSDMETLDLSPYRMVFISNDQPQSFYDKYNDHAARFAEYVEAGGLLWFGAAGSGWNGGFIGDAPLPGEVTVIPDVFEFENEVVQPEHPLVAGMPSPFFGDSASHSGFDGALEGSVVAIGSDFGLPTLLDYSFGSGKVLAIGQPVEFFWAYGGDPGLILENSVPYAMEFQPYTDVPWLSEDPVTGTVDIGQSITVVVTLDATVLEPGVYTAEIVVVTNDPLAPRVSTPVTLTVTG